MLRVYVCLSFHSLHVLILFVHFKVANISKVIGFRFQKYPVKFIGNVTLGNNLSDAKGISVFFLFGGETNKTDFSTSVERLHLEIELHHIHGVCYWARSSHMVDIQFKLIFALIITK